MYPTNSSYGCAFLNAQVRGQRSIWPELLQWRLDWSESGGLGPRGRPDVHGDLRPKVQPAQSLGHQILGRTLQLQTAGLQRGC